MDDQYRRGINRPNADRLTLSLGPLVAQRSLLFRIQADLVHKSTYGELTPAEESAFFAMTPSARILSSALAGKTPMSSASIYSQDSWRPPMSGILKTPFIPGTEEARRRAMVFSPSLHWSGLNSAKDSAPPSASFKAVVEESIPYIGSPVPQRIPEDFTAISPIHSAVLKSAFVADAGIVIPSIEISRASTSFSPVEASAPTVSIPEVAVEVQQHAVTDVQRDSAVIDDGKKLKKKKLVDDASKRTTKHSSAFGRVMAHLSLQPTKKDLDQRRKTALPVISNPLPLMPRSEAARLSLAPNDAPISPTLPVSSLTSTLAIPSLELPAVRFSPIRTSFIANSVLSPESSVKPFSFLSEPMVASMSEAATRAQFARASQGPSRRRTMAPAALNLSPPTLLVPENPGHRRRKSSPAVLNFSWKDVVEDVPPVPKLPAMAGTLKVPF
ncbi:hypothetical protein CVT24_007761 [Panaeolus cyanescens]|uniref:Uncharacterized protein n=1 Tax=Panaeolus cyanescens TaxID=181874 RepID=A0A409YKQ9_9AGAR|nr:hypothetical protein CVT24_007761 [Panaeolus cyanescens]